MSNNPNKLSQFWQELKRRKVVRVITVYAAAAFVILEAVDIVFPRMGFPDWTVTFVIFLIVIGFIITVIVSWIYDIHPEGGIVKTEPSDKAKEEDKPGSSKGWKIASYISFVVIVGLIVLNIIPRTGKKEILDKSIAVLPFINDSPDQERMYFINGTMEAILDNLSKIEDLRLPGRTSMEQYRDNPKPVPIVAEEMNVGYVLEGSGHRDGNNVRLFVQLLDGKKDKHIWSKSYDADIEKIFTMQSEIAQMIASEIQAVITPEEKQLIEKVPTANLTAWELYQRGMNEYYKYHSAIGNREALVMAEDLFHKALEYDSTFALAYTGLTYVYWRSQYWENMSLDNPYDTILILANIALSYDDQLSEAYTARGIYYYRYGLTIEAAEDFNKAIKFNPNNSLAHREIARLYQNNDLVKAIAHLQKAASLYHPELPSLLRHLASVYSDAGFTEKTYHYIQEALKLDGDSMKYYRESVYAEMSLGNYGKAIEYGKKSHTLNSSRNNNISDLAICYLVLGQYEESLKYFKKLIENLKATGSSLGHRMGWIGYAYWQNGYEEEAEYYFNEQINYFNRMNELGGQLAQQLWTYYFLAEVYAFRGEKDKAYENLRSFNQRQTMPSWMVSIIKNDPLFDSIKHEPEFQQIVADIEAKYQAEHERVRKWLEENDML